MRFQLESEFPRPRRDSAWSNPPDYTYPRLAADLAEVVDKLDLRDFVLIGHSMGGMVSLVYAATYPGRVAKLVVIDTTLNMPAERITPAIIADARTRCPHLEFAEVPDSDHHVTLDNPAGFLRAARAFLARQA